MIYLGAFILIACAVMSACVGRMIQSELKTESNPAERRFLWALLAYAWAGALVLMPLLMVGLLGFL